MVRVRDEAPEVPDGPFHDGSARRGPARSRPQRPSVRGPAREDAGSSLPVPGNIVGPCLLLLLAESPSHGYELADRVRGFGFPDSSARNLYRELRRLEEAGLVSSSWHADQTRGPARRVYRLTGPGNDALLGCAKDAEELGRLLDRYVRRVRAARRRLPKPAGKASQPERAVSRLGRERPPPISRDGRTSRSDAGTGGPAAPDG